MDNILMQFICVKDNNLWYGDGLVSKTTSAMFMQYHIDGLMQEKRNSIANALELRLSCTNPSICNIVYVPLPSQHSVQHICVINKLLFLPRHITWMSQQKFGNINSSVIGRLRWVCMQLVHGDQHTCKVTHFVNELNIEGSVVKGHAHCVFATTDINALHGRPFSFRLYFGNMEYLFFRKILTGQSLVSYVTMHTNHISIASVLKQNKPIFSALFWYQYNWCICYCHLVTIVFPVLETCLYV